MGAIALRKTLWAIAVITFVFGVSGAALAQADRTKAIDDAQEAYADVRADIEADDVDDTTILEDRLRSLREESRQRLQEAETEIEDVQAQLAPLGAPPGEDDPPESDDLAEQRAALDEKLVLLNGQKIRITANIAEASELLGRLSAGRVQTLYERLLERGATPFAPSVWRPGASSAIEIVQRIGAYFDQWRAQKQSDGVLPTSLAFVFGAFIVSIVIFWPVNRWIMTTFSAAIERHEPTPSRRIAVAGLKMIARTLPGVIGGAVVIETLRVQGVITEAGESPAQALWFALIAYLFVSGLTRGLFAPASPAWSIAPVDAARGKAASTLILAIVILFGVKVLLTEIAVAAGGEPELLRLIAADSAVVFGTLLYLLCRGRLWRRVSERETDDEAATVDNDHPPESLPDARGWRVLRRLVRVLAIVIILAAAVGYVTLADFIASRIYYLALLIAFAWFARALLKEFAFWLRTLLRSRKARGSSDDEMIAAENFKFWTNWFVNLMLALAVVPTVLILAGAPPATIRDIASEALFGFYVGGVRVPSLVNIAYAILVFVVVVALTKIAQRAFEKGPFAHANMGIGVQNSLKMLIGYAGLLAAILAAVSAIGFDLRNLALIAGALSVGIGFGLQSIVNNFVSGLILLFERPIKVGDWIVTPSGEGTVKRISVRSTVIETFDRSSIIVPNSELISSAVMNWTHKNKIGRIKVPVGVSYKSDPETVRDILLKCANDHPMIVKYPEPFVVWQDFGASSLDFEIRAYLADISKGLAVRTELRFAIFKALKEAGIEIPYPQQDVYVKSWPDDGVAPVAKPQVGEG